MQTIQLECPQCKSLLELDSGFAGGVCRCSNCGTLMTVPADPSRERAETLSRPDAPGTPGSPGAPGRPAVPAATEAGRPDRPDEPGISTAPPPEPTATPGDGETVTYTTASGKIVRLSRRIKIPTASAKTKRKVVRIGTAAIFIGVIGGIVAFIIVVMVMMMGGNDAQRLAEDEQRRIEGYDASRNPFTLDEANVLSVPLESTAVVLVDAGDGSKAWFSLAKDALAAGLKKATGNMKQQVIFYRENGQDIYPAEMKRAVDDAEAFQRFLDTATTSGVARPDLAIDKALEAEPRQLILVTGRPLSKASLDNVAESLEDKGVKLDVVIVNDEQPELADLAKAHDGRFLTIPTSQITRWYREAHAEE